MCSGGPIDITAVTYPTGKRCSYATQWINRLLNNVTALNVTKVSLLQYGVGVWIPRGFTINMTYVDRYSVTLYHQLLLKCCKS